MYPEPKPAGVTAGRPTRVPPLGIASVRKGVHLRRKDLAYLLRLAREKSAGRTPLPGEVSSELGKAIDARRRFRHDLRGQLNALQLVAECLRRNLYNLEETSLALDSLTADLAHLLSQEE